MGIGCSVIASSIVAFLTYSYREKESNITKTVQEAGFISSFNNSEIINAIQDAKNHVNIMSKNPYVLVRHENFEIFRHLSQEGVKVRILFENDTINKNTLDVHEQERKWQLIQSLERLKQIAPLVEIRSTGILTQRIVIIDESIYYSSFNSDSYKQGFVLKIDNKSLIHKELADIFNISWRDSDVVPFDL